MSGILKVGGSELINDNGGSGSLQWGTGVPAGSIVQTKFAGFDGVQTIGNGSNGTTFVNIGLGVSGEEFSLSMAVSSGNKIIGFGNVNISGSSRYSALKVFMDSTQIACGTEDLGSNRAKTTTSAVSNDNNSNEEFVMFNSSFSFNYTPSDTSSHIYTVKAGNTHSGSEYTYINRPKNNDDGGYVQRGYSHFMLMEVAQ